MKLLEIIKDRELEQCQNSLLELKLDSDDFYKSVSSGMIDLFSHVLTLEEMDNYSFDFRDLNLKNEYRYVNLFYKLFEMNGPSSLIVYMDFKNLQNYEHINILEELDLYEKNLWVNQMLYLNNEDVTDYFLVNDLELLKMLVQLNIREREFAQFHFTGLDVVIRGSYDCSMSIYSKNSSSIGRLKPIVESHELFIRSFELGEDT